MGVLRLLYCDSAGVRRCRAIVYKGELPAVTAEHTDTTAAANGLAAATVIATNPALQPTPSLIEAAAAGVITLFPLVPDDKSSPQQHHPTPLPPSALTPSQAASAGPFAQKAAAFAAVAEDAATGISCSTNGIKPAGRSQSVSHGTSAADVAAARAATAYGTGLTIASMGMPVVADMMVPGSGLIPVGEVRMIPDLSAVQVLPWAPGHIMAPAEMWDRDLSRPSPFCPRAALKNALSALEQAHDIKLMLGFELEFTLLRPVSMGSLDDPNLVLTAGGRTWDPVDQSVYCQSSSLDRMSSVLDAMTSALQSMGIDVQQYHAESGPGQFEISTAPYHALEAVDKLLYSKEAITAVAHQHGLEVTFLPKPYSALAGNGCHCHISLWQAHPELQQHCSASSYNSSSNTEDIPLMTAAPGTVPIGRSSQSSGQCVPEGYPTLSNTAAAFLAGLVEHLPGLLAFTAPTNNSYERLKPGTWSGCHVCWGYDNKEAPLRVCCPDPERPETTNIEYKAFDGTANPYVGVTAIIAAAMRGLQEASVLPPPTQIIPNSDDTATAKLKCLPASLPDAIAAFEKDNSLQTKLQQLLGPELLKAFLAVRRFEAAEVKDSSSILLRYS